MKIKKKDLKQLKKLTIKFENKQVNGYNIVTGIQHWFEQNNIQFNNKYLNIVYLIYGAVPYVYDIKVRQEILDFIKEYKNA